VLLSTDLLVTCYWRLSVHPLAGTAEINITAQIGLFLDQGAANRAWFIYGVFGEYRFITPGIAEQIRFRVPAALRSHRVNRIF
jgi:hypothetical protein